MAWWPAETARKDVRIVAWHPRFGMTVVWFDKSRKIFVRREGGGAESFTLWTYVEPPTGPCDKKRCGACKTVKPLAEFHRDANRADGRQPRCAACVKDAKRRRRNARQAELDKLADKTDITRGADFVCNAEPAPTLAHAPELSA